MKKILGLFLLMPLFTTFISPSEKSHTIKIIPDKKRACCDVVVFNNYSSSTITSLTVQPDVGYSFSFTNVGPGQTVNTNYLGTYATYVVITFKTSRTYTNTSPGSSLLVFPDGTNYGCKNFLGNSDTYSVYMNHGYGTHTLTFNDGPVCY